MADASRRALVAAPLLMAAGPATTDAWSFRLPALEGGEHDLGAWRGRVLLVVNTASKCGYTTQYEGLEALHQRLSARGFAVIGFPSNDFMGQEPGSEEQIAEFCTLTYGVKFPMYEKVVVKGPQATGLYRQLAAASAGQTPRWNFHKYLVSRSGKVVGSYGSSVEPHSKALIQAIEQQLAAPR